MTPAPDPGAEGAQGDGPPDAQTALPDLERVERMPAVTEVGRRAGDQVVEPAADDPERHRPQRHVQHLTRLPTAICQASLGDPDRRDDARQDAHGVRPEGERADEPDRLSRAGDGCGQLVAALTAAARDSGVVRVLVMSLPLSFTVGVPVTPAFPDAVSTSAQEAT